MILTKLRGEKTQAEVAKGIGVTRQAICMYECGARIASDAVKKRIADYYGKTVEEIFFTEE